MADVQDLNVGKTVALDASGNGTITLQPNSGPPIWHVKKVIIKTSRRGQAPIPAFELYLSSQSPNNLQGNSYDGSWDESDFDLRIARGLSLIAVWTGGLAGDIATISLTGERLMN